MVQASRSLPARPPRNPPPNRCARCLRARAHGSSPPGLSVPSSAFRVFRGDGSSASLDRMNVTCLTSLRPSNRAWSCAREPGSWDPGQSAFPLAATGRASARCCASANREADGRRCSPMGTAATPNGRSPQNHATHRVRQSGTRLRGAHVRHRAAAGAARRANHCAWTLTGGCPASRHAWSLRDLRPGVRAAYPRAPRRRPKSAAVGTPEIAARWWCKRGSAVIPTSARGAARRVAAPAPATLRPMRTQPESGF